MSFVHVPLLLYSNSDDSDAVCRFVWRQLIRRHDGNMEVLYNLSEQLVSRPRVQCIMHFIWRQAMHVGDFLCPIVTFFFFYIFVKVFVE
jgi:hypothetical protein